MTRISIPIEDFTFMEKYPTFTLSAFAPRYRPALDLPGVKSGRDVNPDLNKNYPRGDYHRMDYGEILAVTAEPSFLRARL